MFFTRLAGAKWTNRGDADVDDWAVGDLTKDGNWHNLDLTGVMTKGSSIVLIKLKACHTEASVSCLFRTKGVTNENAIQNRDLPNTAMVLLTDTLMLQPDSDGIIQYKFSAAATWLVLSLRIMGWLK